MAGEFISSNMMLDTKLNNIHRKLSNRTSMKVSLSLFKSLCFD